MKSRFGVAGEGSLSSNVQQHNQFPFHRISKPNPLDSSNIGNSLSLPLEKLHK